MRKICFMGKEYAGYTTADMSNPALDIETYGTSSTASRTVIKVISTNNGDFERISGAYVVVTFANANTGIVSLDVDGTGPRPAYYNGARINAINGNFQSGDTVVFMYDGTYYHRLDTDTDDTSILKGLAKLGWSDVLLKGKLSLKKVLAKILNCDYVIEDANYIGTNGEVRYKKWAHGTLEISVFLYGFNLTNYASDYYGWYPYTYTLNWNDITPINIPVFINTNYTVTQTWTIGRGMASPGTVLNKTTNQVGLYSMCAQSGSLPVEINVELKGLWK